MTKCIDMPRARRHAKKQSGISRGVGLAISAMALIAGAVLGFGAGTEKMPLVMTAHGLGASYECDYELGDPAYISIPDQIVPLSADMGYSDGYENKPYTKYEAETMAKMLWGEARGCGRTSQAASAWCALNRVDDPRWPNDITSVITQRWQFCGYDPENPVDPDILALAEDVLDRYFAEKSGDIDSGRVLPRDYCFFTGDGIENYFRVDFEDAGVYWDWSLPSPYAT